MNQQNIQEAFIHYCKTKDISAEEINNPYVFYNTPEMKALTEAMDQDKQFAEDTLNLIAKELKNIPPYRACLSAFFIGLYGERGVSSLYADRDLLDFFDAAVKYVMSFIVSITKKAGIRQYNKDTVKQVLGAIDVEKMTQTNPELIEIIKGLTQLCTAVLSRISQSRPMRAYLRETKVGPVCMALGTAFPAAGFIGAMLNVVEQQQVLVLFPNYKTGFEITVEEVDSNFSMFSLLQIALAKEGYMSKLGLPHFTYNQDADRALSRNFKEMSELPNPLPDMSVFNYYNLHAITKEGRHKYHLDSDYRCEGKESIESLGTLDGRHILLVDKLTRPETWANAAVYGIHPNQHPKLTINRMLPKEEYEKWLEMVLAIGSYAQYDLSEDEEDSSLS